MLIGQLAQATMVSRDTIRFYEKQGLIRSHKQENGYKSYSKQTVDTIHFIKLAQELGFSLREIADITPMLMGGTLASELVSTFIDNKIALIDQRIANLQQLKQRLLTLPIGESCPLRRDCSTLTTH
ncbi:MerR family transcriptional regulator [Agitococcus lubricus]|uniref:MerR family copper efflux transcriptional regulator n=1 Tax=Agitococcus lubricus TaxID=1077255 RepID=A0A2T5J472_9GAMM|nr:MerR family transcriptional regulator [Agitococcus lubricus]PTQ91402.1 MerR family copper efflux transcriptional regulator [Agitococcus lubricus]